MRATPLAHEAVKVIGIRYVMDVGKGGVDEIFSGRRLISEGKYWSRVVVKDTVGDKAIPYHRLRILNKN